MLTWLETLTTTFVVSVVFDSEFDSISKPGVYNVCDNKSRSNFPQAFDSGAVLKQTSTTTWFGTSTVVDISTPGQWPKSVFRVDVSERTGRVDDVEHCFNVRKESSLKRRLHEAQSGWRTGYRSYVLIRDYEKNPMAAIDSMMHGDR